MTQHVAGLRGLVSETLIEALLDEDLGLDPDVYEALTAQIEARIDGIQFNGPGRAAEFATVVDATNAMLRKHGVDARIRPEDAVAAVGWSALLNAERLIQEPAKASQADLDVMIAMAYVAEASLDQIARLEPQPEPQRPDLSRWQSSLQPLQQAPTRTVQPVPDPEPAEEYDPKPH